MLCGANMVFTWSHSQFNDQTTFMTSPISDSSVAKAVSSPVPCCPNTPFYKLYRWNSWVQFSHSIVRDWTFRLRWPLLFNWGSSYFSNGRLIIHPREHGRVRHKTMLQVQESVAVLVHCFQLVPTRQRRFWAHGHQKVFGRLSNLTANLARLSGTRPYTRQELAEVTAAYFICDTTFRSSNKYSSTLR